MGVRQRPEGAGWSKKPVGLCGLCAWSSGQSPVAAGGTAQPDLTLVIGHRQQLPKVAISVCCSVCGRGLSECKEG